MSDEHYRRLERLYAGAPISRWYGARITVGEGRAEVTFDIRPEFHHAANAVHGSVYFRALDDAAFFAANSMVAEVFVLTVSFTVQFVRPVVDGKVTASGRLLHGGGRLLHATSELRDDAGRLLGSGTGVFARSRIALGPEIGYR